MSSNDFFFSAVQWFGFPCLVTVCMCARCGMVTNSRNRGETSAKKTNSVAASAKV
jgi:hypothetical protein